MSRREALLESALQRHRVQLGVDVELARHAPSPQAREQLARCRTSIDCLATACACYAERTCFAERARTIEAGVLRPLSTLEYVSYAELWSRVQRVASGLHHAGLVRSGTTMGICGFGSVDWVVADFAALYLAAISVPIPTAAAAAELVGIIRNAALSAVVCSLAQLPAIADVLPSCPSVRSLLVIDYEPRIIAHREAYERGRRAVQSVSGVLLQPMAELAELGVAKGILPPVSLRTARLGESDPLMTLMYTSGSTGTPKGAMYPESIWHKTWQAAESPGTPAIALVTVAYMPLNHFAGRVAGIMRTIVQGGLASFALASDMSTFLEDLRLTRPTAQLLVPRAAALLHQHFQTEVLKRAAVAHAPDVPAIEAELLRELRSGLLGERLVYLMTGAAPTAPQITDFLERCFDVPVLDLYGSTEAGPIAFDGKIVSSEVTAVKLVDVPELGYHRTDVPHPRGELRVKSSRSIPGYYRDPDATAGLFDAEGYVITGDIVEQPAPDQLVWIDRKKNIVKLAQGEFVNISRLEELYRAGSPFIEHVYLYGNSQYSYLLAVVAPHRSTADTYLEQRGITPDDAAIQRLLRAEMDRVARSATLRAYEIPRELLVVAEPFTVENGLLTESRKLARSKLKARFGARLEALYQEIEQKQLGDYLALKGDGERSPEELVRGAVQVALGLAELDPGQSFLQLGGDSFNAVRLAQIVQELTGVPVPVGFILDPTSTVGALAAYVAAQRAGGSAAEQPGVAMRPSSAAEEVQASELRLESFIPEQELVAHARGADAPGGTVLLTGGNGFLGRFLLLSLLERAARDGGKVICLVRGGSDAQAAERLAAGYRGPDPALIQRFATVATPDRLTVLAGDLGRPRLGLSRERWEQLANEVGVILHSGALVNHAFSYLQLFEPNVLGSVELMRLALRGRRKSIGFVSTVAVAMGDKPRPPVREEEDGRALWQSRPNDSGYSVGYATSKWACELLLAELAQRCEVPVDVFRCSMIMPPRDAIGQVNAGDFLMRLWIGILLTGLAPRSFYVDGGARHHFDGLPVDFVAESITAITLASKPPPSPPYQTYHVVNAHWDDGVSLDSMLAWMESAGYTLTRFADYGVWYHAFREALSRLNPADQHRSPLPILFRWQSVASEPDLVFDASRFRQRLHEIGGATALPSLTEEYIHKCLRDLELVGLVPARQRLG